MALMAFQAHDLKLNHDAVCLLDNVTLLVDNKDDRIHYRVIEF